MMYNLNSGEIQEANSKAISVSDVYKRQVLLSLSQFLTTSAGDVEFLYLAISVRQIYAFSSIVFPITPISTPFAFILDVGNIKSPPLINMIYCNIMYYQYMVVNIKLLHWRNEKSRMR